jgi:hypothetical protein
MIFATADNVATRIQAFDSGFLERPRDWPIKAGYVLAFAMQREDFLF